MMKVSMIQSKTQLIMRKSAFLAILGAVTALAVSAQAATRPFVTKFGQEWEKEEKLKTPEMWRLNKKGGASFISVSVLDISNPQVIKKGKPEKIKVESLRRFAQAREKSLSVIGIKNWQILGANAVNKKWLQFSGQYRGPSGNTICFVERQAEQGSQIVQVIATENLGTSEGGQSKHARSCRWQEMAKWLDQVSLTKI